MAGRPNKLIKAMKERDFRTFLWEALLHEYRCAKIGNVENRLGPNALTSLIAALREIESSSTPESNRGTLTEIEDWIKKVAK